jgi:hypothetical protein
LSTLGRVECRGFPRYGHAVQGCLLELPPLEETVVQTVIKVLGIAALIWIAFTVLGWVLGLAIKLLFWALVIGAAVLVASAVYGALKGKPDRKALR